MAQAVLEKSSGSNWKRVVAWLLVVLDLFIIGGVVFVWFKGIVPGTAGVPSLQLVQDVTLPGVAVAPQGHAPIAAVPFDRFDFQALDPQSGLLFITHPGPSANKIPLAKKQLPVGTQLKSNLIVFDTKKQAPVTTIAIPNVHGVAVVPGSGYVYAGDATDDLVYVIDSHTLRIITKIALDTRLCTALPCETPDAFTYDQVDHKLFITDQGSDKAYQDIGVIDTQTNRLIDKIALGTDQWGDAIGHTQYDPVTKRLFVAVQPQVNPKTPNALPAPAQFVSIDAASDRIVARLTLPNTHVCNDPHGLVLDSAQRVAFTACVVTNNILMLDLHNLSTIKVSNPFPVGLKPDILRIDSVAHTLYVATTVGVSVFDEGNAGQGELSKISDYRVDAGSSHTIAVDEQTHDLYFPLINVKGKPIMRIERL